MKVHEALNLYKLHSNPEKLDKYDLYYQVLRKPNKWAYLKTMYRSGFSINTGNTLEELITSIEPDKADFIGLYQQYNPNEIDRLVPPYIPKPYIAKPYINIRTQSIEQFKTIISKMEPKCLFGVTYEEGFGGSVIVVTETPIKEVKNIIDLKYY